MESNKVSVTWQPSPESLKLSNGSLVLVISPNKHNVIETFIVTSFRNGRPGSTMQYCSLVSLSSGYLACEEHVSRSTTVPRVMSHLKTFLARAMGVTCNIDDFILKVVPVGCAAINVDIYPSVKGV